jgi:hypothetical protein
MKKFIFLASIISLSLVAVDPYDIEGLKDHRLNDCAVAAISKFRSILDENNKPSISKEKLETIKQHIQKEARIIKSEVLNAGCEMDRVFGTGPAKYFIWSDSDLKYFFLGELLYIYFSKLCKSSPGCARAQLWLNGHERFPNNQKNRLVYYENLFETLTTSVHS